MASPGMVAPAPAQRGRQPRGSLGSEHSDVRCAHEATKKGAQRRTGWEEEHKRKRPLAAQTAVSGPGEGAGGLGWGGLDKAARSWEVGRGQKNSLSNIALGEKCDRGALRQPLPTHCSPTHASLGEGRPVLHRLARTA